MKKAMVLGVFFIVLLALCSCSRYKSSSYTAPREISSDFSYKLNVVVPVALKNSSSKSPNVEEVLCQYGTWDVMGSLYNFTNSAIGTASIALQRQRIVINDKADKKLEFSVYKATCERGWKYTAMAWLRVRTGSGLTKEYQGQDTYGNDYQSAAGFEGAMLRCIEQMLHDKEIVDYLEK